VEIHLVSEPGVARGVRCRQVVQLERGAVGQNDPLPDEQGAPLAESDHAVVAADQARSLGDQQEAARGAIEHILCDLRDH